MNDCKKKSGTMDVSADKEKPGGSKSDTIAMNDCKKSGITDVISADKEKPGGSSSNTSVLPKNWQIDYKNSIQTLFKLSQYIDCKMSESALIRKVTTIFPLRIPFYYLSLIKNFSDQNDPIRKQCVPSVEEGLVNEENEKVDPLGEVNNSPETYLVHRYPDRALLLVTSRCFMYCRHCTRKRLWKNKIPDPTFKDIAKSLDYVKNNKAIREIIVSGGDPLTLPTEKLDYILSSISKIKHIESIRIGTRAPVVFPQRIDKALCSVLEKYENLWINVQFNHPVEITPESTEACKKLQKCGIPISNQSVLLKGVNDDIKVMIELCQKLQSIRVRPYYLFQCDPVMGASHFRTTLWKGVQIIENMRGHTGGLCIPTFVVDGIDGKGKVPLGPNYMVSVSKEGVTLRNYKNEEFLYYDPAE